MKSWDVTALDAEPRMPRILSSSGDARVVVLVLGAGERLQEHEVHERSWIVVVAGEVDVDPDTGERVRGEVGALFEFEPQERREVTARSDSRLLLLLAPWPGEGHPGALSLEQKANARAHAAEYAESRRG